MIRFAAATCAVLTLAACDPAATGGNPFADLGGGGTASAGGTMGAMSVSKAFETIGCQTRDLSGIYVLMDLTQQTQGQVIAGANALVEAGQARKLGRNAYRLTTGACAVA